MNYRYRIVGLCLILIFPILITNTNANQQVNGTELVNFGLFAPMTGGNGVYGEGIVEAATMAVNDLNSDSSSPFLFNLTLYDTGSSETGAVARMQAANG